MTEMTLLPAARRIAERRGMKCPDDIDSFGLRVCRADMMSSLDYRWPFPGHWAESSGPFTESSDPCPQYNGDGLCVGLTWAGMSSGGQSADVVLLVGYRDADVLAHSATKLRVKRAFVVDTFTVKALLAERHSDEPLDLTRADLRGVDLRGVDLRSAILRCADLSRADLEGAVLTRTDLTRAVLRGAIGYEPVD